MPDFSALVLDGERGFARLVVECLAAAGVPAHVLALGAWSPTRFSRRRASFHARESAGEEDHLEAIRRAVARSGADVVLAVKEETVQLLAAHPGALPETVRAGLVPPVEAFDLVVDKGRLAAFLAERGIPHPATLPCSGDDAFEEAVADLVFPLLLKPVRGGDSGNIRRFETRAALRAFFRTKVYPRGTFIVQHFVPGFDIDCSVLCREGEVLAHTIQKGLIPRRRPFAPAAGIVFVEHEGVLAVVRRLMRALQWSGVAHVDLRCDPEGRVWVIEVNPRYWGSLLGSLAAGVNFPLLACRSALGRPFAPPAYRPVRYVTAGAALRTWRRPGRLRPALAWAETEWRFILADPLPEAVRSARRMLRSVGYPWSGRGAKPPA
jgi:predicted ATP-grasp superfamily ATP-dependent carboligase